ncbi:hypothetical protein IFR05_017093 [Cadophora sp. M221]|nr:hypothetical protein IFR05_017093 [Cadophora sp. M221]
MLSTGLGIKPGYVDVVAALFAAGAKITPWARNALHGEDLKQDPALIRLFFENGLDPNATQSTDREINPDAKESRGEPLLRFMADPACAREFLSRGADPNASGPSNETPLYSIITSRNIEVAEVLLEHGATLEPNFLFDVMGYYWRGQDRELKRERMLKYLLEKGVDPNKAVSEKWGSPLHHAAFYGNENMVRMLADAGADLTARAVGGRHPGCTPEEVAMSRVD